VGRLARDIREEVQRGTVLTVPQASLPISLNVVSAVDIKRDGQKYSYVLN
jgi:hypothetical protein